jgi:hypothetical protein
VLHREGSIYISLEYSCLWNSVELCIAASAQQKSKLCVRIPVNGCSSGMGHASDRGYLTKSSSPSLFRYFLMIFIGSHYFTVLEYVYSCKLIARIGIRHFGSSAWALSHRFLFFESLDLWKSLKLVWGWVTLAIISLFRTYLQLWDVYHFIRISLQLNCIVCLHIINTFDCREIRIQWSDDWIVLLCVLILIAFSTLCMIIIHFGNMQIC